MTSEEKKVIFPEKKLRSQVFNLTIQFISRKENGLIHESLFSRFGPPLFRPRHAITFPSYFRHFRRRSHCEITARQHKETANSVRLGCQYIDSDVGVRRNLACLWLWPTKEIAAFTSLSLSLSPSLSLSLSLSIDENLNCV